MACCLLGLGLAAHPGPAPEEGELDPAVKELMGWTEEDESPDHASDPWWGSAPVRVLTTLSVGAVAGASTLLVAGLVSMVLGAASLVAFSLPILAFPLGYLYLPVILAWGVALFACCLVAGMTFAVGSSALAGATIVDLYGHILSKNRARGPSSRPLVRWVPLALLTVALGTAWGAVVLGSAGFTTAFGAVGWMALPRGADGSVNFLGNRERVTRRPRTTRVVTRVAEGSAYASAALAMVAPIALLGVVIASTGWLGWRVLGTTWGAE